MVPAWCTGHGGHSGEGCTDSSHDHGHKEHGHSSHGHGSPAAGAAAPSAAAAGGIVVHKTGFKTGVGSGHADPNHVHEVVTSPPPRGGSAGGVGDLTLPI